MLNVGKWSLLGLALWGLFASSAFATASIMPPVPALADCEFLLSANILTREEQLALRDTLLDPAAVDYADARTSLPNFAQRDWILRELRGLLQRVDSGEEALYRVTRDNSHAFVGINSGPDLFYAEVDYVFRHLRNTNILERSTPVRRWLLHRAWLPRQTNLALNDQGEALRLPRPGDRGELVAFYLTSKFGLQFGLLPSRFVSDIMSAQLYPGGPLISFRSSEIFDAERLHRVVESVVAGRTFLTNGALPGLVYRTENAAEFSRLLLNAGWQPVRHDGAEITIFTDPVSGASVYLPFSVYLNGEGQDFGPHDHETMERAVFNATELRYEAPGASGLYLQLPEVSLRSIN